MSLADVVVSPYRTEFVHRDPAHGRLLSTRKKICISGAGCQVYPLTTDEDRSLEWETWCCNALWDLGFDPENRFRADRWFELHPKNVQSANDLDNLLHSPPVPIYTLQYSPEWVPQSYIYPLHAIIEYLPYTSDFCSTFAYQMALAMYLDCTTIRLVGIRMAQGREYIIERPNLLYWIGLAEGRGITVQLINCSLHDTRFFYGYEYVREKEWAEQRCRDSIMNLARDGFRGSQ